MRPCGYVYYEGRVLGNMGKILHENWCNDRLEQTDKVKDRFFRFVYGDKNLKGWRIDAQLHHSVPM